MGDAIQYISHKSGANTPELEALLNQFKDYELIQGCYVIEGVSYEAVQVWQFTQDSDTPTLTGVYDLNAQPLTGGVFGECRKLINVVSNTFEYVGAEPYACGDTEPEPVNCDNVGLQVDYDLGTATVTGTDGMINPSISWTVVGGVINAGQGTSIITFSGGVTDISVIVKSDECGTQTFTDQPEPEPCNGIVEVTQVTESVEYCLTNFQPTYNVYYEDKSTHYNTEFSYDVTRNGDVINSFIEQTAPNFIVNNNVNSPPNSLVDGFYFIALNINTPAISIDLSSVVYDSSNPTAFENGVITLINNALLANGVPASDLPLITLNLSTRASLGFNRRANTNFCAQGLNGGCYNPVTDDVVSMQPGSARPTTALKPKYTTPCGLIGARVSMQIERGECEDLVSNVDNTTLNVSNHGNNIPQCITCKETTLTATYTGNGTPAFNWTLGSGLTLVSGNLTDAIITVKGEGSATVTVTVDGCPDIKQTVDVVIPIDCGTLEITSETTDATEICLTDVAINGNATYNDGENTHFQNLSYAFSVNGSPANGVSGDIEVENIYIRFKNQANAPLINGSYINEISFINPAITIDLSSVVFDDSDVTGFENSITTLVQNALLSAGYTMANMPLIEFDVKNNGQYSFAFSFTAYNGYAFCAYGNTANAGSYYDARRGQTVNFQWEGVRPITDVPVNYSINGCSLETVIRVHAVHFGGDGSCNTFNAAWLNPLAEIIGDTCVLCEGTTTLNGVYTGEGTPTFNWTLDSGLTLVSGNLTDAVITISGNGTATLTATIDGCPDLIQTISVGGVPRKRELQTLSAASNGGAELRTINAGDLVNVVTYYYSDGTHETFIVDACGNPLCELDCTTGEFEPYNPNRQTNNLLLKITDTINSLNTTNLNGFKALESGIEKTNVSIVSVIELLKASQNPKTK